MVCSFAACGARFVRGTAGRFPQFQHELRELGVVWSIHDAEFWMCEYRKLRNSSALAALRFGVAVAA